MDLHKLTIPQAIDGLNKGAFSAEDLTRACIERTKETDTELRAFITITEKAAIESAKEIDKKRANNEQLPPLAGIPGSIKDVIAQKGVKTTACSNILKNYIAPYSATSINNLENEGAVFTGKTNCDAFAHGASTENSDFGASKNPWDTSRVPGGSSGGSAVSVAAGQSLFAIGSDTGGSIRQPASFCGISAIKPTYGRVSRYGLFSMTSSTDCISPMAKTVEGLAYVLEAMAGHDENDGTTPNVPVAPYVADLKKADLKGKKIGIPKEYFTDEIHPEVRKAVEASMDVYKKLGAEFIDISLPHTKYAVSVYYIITPSEVSSNLARFDGIRYGYSVVNDKDHAEEVESLYDVYAKSRQYGFGDETKRRIMVGTYALSSGYYDAYYRKASAVRTLIKQDFEKAFEEVDLILTPTSPKVAFKLGAQDKDPLQMYLEDIFVAPASLAGVPALSIPCGLASPNEDDTISLPVGLQLIAPQFSESALLQAGYLFQQETDWHTRVNDLL